MVFANFPCQYVYLKTFGNLSKHISCGMRYIACKNLISVLCAPNDMEAQVENGMASFAVFDHVLYIVKGSLKAPPKGGGLKPRAWQLIIKHSEQTEYQFNY